MTRWPRFQVGKPEGRKQIQSTKVIFNGYKFDSKAECIRYKELLVLSKAEIITGLEVHPAMRLTVNDVPVCLYTPDFRYQQEGKTVIEDVKGNWKNKKAMKATTNWQIFRLKAKLVFAITGIEVTVIERG